VIFFSHILDELLSDVEMKHRVQEKVSKILDKYNQLQMAIVE